MIELALSALLDFVAVEFCVNKAEGMSTLKSTLIAYSKANEKFGAERVIKTITDAKAIEVAAMAAVATKCPQHI